MSALLINDQTTVYDDVIHVKISLTFNFYHQIIRNYENLELNYLL